MGAGVEGEGAWALMRTLVVTHTHPWPPAGGGAIRMDHTLRALSARGPVDVVSILHRDRARRLVDTTAPGIERLLVVPRPVAGSGRLEQWGRAVASRRPAIRSADYEPLRARVDEWLAGHDYDLVWLGCGTEGFVALGPVLPGGVPVVANLDDLEDDKIAARLAVGGRWRESGLRAWLARQPAAVRDRIEIRRWRRLHREIGREVTRVVVCSDDDRRRLTQIGVDSTVVPNTYDDPEVPLGRIDVGDPPTLTLIGTLDYRPNADAAEFAVSEVLPLVRERVPEVQLRLVGRSGPSTAHLSSAAGVVTTGFVDDVLVELGRADVVVVPIRIGSGTRIKILEAFAHRIPVVATTLGCSGLGVTSGRELVIADQPETFAAACVELLTDPGRRSRLTESAHRFWAQHYRPENHAAAVSGVVAAVLAESATHSA